MKKFRCSRFKECRSRCFHKHLHYKDSECNKICHVPGGYSSQLCLPIDQKTLLYNKLRYLKRKLKKKNGITISFDRRKLTIKILRERINSLILREKIDSIK